MIPKEFVLCSIFRRNKIVPRLKIKNEQIPIIIDLTWNVGFVMIKQQVFIMV
jgi:hypothetical protein